MGMNNVYYRFLHLVENDEYAKLPARLRMKAPVSPGIDKTDFELLARGARQSTAAASASPPTRRSCESRRSPESVQSAVRIASVVHAVAGVIDYENARAAWIPPKA